MTKRSRAICLALLTYFAFVALPAVASAKSQLYSGGTPVVAGTQIKGTSIGGVQFELPGGSSFACSAGTLTGTVYSNVAEKSQTVIESGNFTGAAAEGKCSTPLGPAAISLDAPLCLTVSEASVPSWRLRGKSCSVAEARPGLTLTTSLVGKCHYQSSPSVYEMTSNVNSEPLVLNTKNQWFTVDKGFPPGCFSGLNPKALFEFKTSAGAGLELSN
jgi:hypothetical protein